MQNRSVFTAIGLGLSALISVALFLRVPATQTNMRDIGPAVIAKYNHRLWPDSINNKAGFDKASRALLLAFAVALQKTLEATGVGALDLQAPDEIPILDRPSVRKWLNQERAQLLLNYNLASRYCLVTDWTCAANVKTYDDLVNKSHDLKSTIPNELLQWWENTEEFSHFYVLEQLRLAALFPSISSEIDRFNDNEWNGDSLPDKQFFLTFDDGPSPVRGTTDDVLAMLDTEKKNASFFLIGKDLQNRLNETGATLIAELYRNNCIASHGWEHQSQAIWDRWQESIKRTQALLDETFVPSNVLPLFRPPYGQRKADSEAFFRTQGLRVVLWNLDSQDWNNQMDFNDIVDRMIALMLLKRHGIILFHDVHPKTTAAVPLILKEVGNAVDWEDCHLLATQTIK